MNCFERKFFILRPKLPLIYKAYYLAVIRAWLCVGFNQPVLKRLGLLILHGIIIQSKATLAAFRRIY